MKKGLLRSISLALVLTLCMSVALAGTAYAAEEERMSDATLTKLLEERDYEGALEAVRKDETHIIDETVDAVVTIDESVEMIYREDQKRMLGVQYETNRGYDLIIDENRELLPTYLDVAEKMYEQPMVRWGGGSSNNYNLWNMVQDFNNRAVAQLQDDPGIHDWYVARNGLTEGTWTSFMGANVMDYGPIEFIKAQQAINPDVEFIFSISNYAQSVEDTVKFVRWCLDDQSTEYGRMRAQAGIPDPINLYGLEMSNELYYTSTPKSEEIATKGTDWYVRTCREHGEAVKAIYPDVAIIPCVNGNSDRAGFWEWDVPVIRDLGQSLTDEFAFHLYYSGYEFAHTRHWIFDCISIMEEYFGEDHGLKLAFTEHSAWGSGFTTRRWGWYAGLATAHFVNVFSNYDFITLATMHCGIAGGPGSPTNWGMMSWFYGEDPYTLNFTPMNYLYDVYEKEMGNVVMPVDIQSDHPITDVNSNARKFSILATPRENNELALFMVNREPYIDMNLTFETGNNYTITKEITINAPNIWSFEMGDEGRGTIFDIQENAKNEKLDKYYMPNKSFVCLVLKSDKPIIGGADGAASDEVVFEGADLFNDIKGNWAAAEINLLAQSGIVSGVGDGNFAPQESISVAELSSMLQKALNVPVESDSAQIFPMVNKGAWYYDAINALALKGFIRRSADIQPDSAATLRFAVTTLYQAAGNPKVENTAKYEGQYAWYANLSAYEKDAFTYAIDNNIITKLFEASDADAMRSMTRAEAASLVYRAQQLGL